MNNDINGFKWWNGANGHVYVNKYGVGVIDEGVPVTSGLPSDLRQLQQRGDVFFSDGRGGYHGYSSGAQIADPNPPRANDAPDTSYNSSAYSTDTATSNAAAQAAAEKAAADKANEIAAYDDQITNINKLLGYTNTQKEQGLASLQSGFDDETRKLGDAKTKTMTGYDDQNVENSQNKQRGVEDVDQYANSSYNNLQRLLQGSHAGNSSVGRELVPYLVSKSAGTRRQGVFDTAGKNEQAIVKARACRRQNQKNS